MSGVGQYTSVGAAAAAVKHALHTVAATALEGQEVDVGFGFIWPGQWLDSVSCTAVRVTPLDATLGPRGRRQMDVYQDVNIVSFRAVNDEAVPHDIAYGLLDVLDQATRTDPTLGGAALWCRSDDLQSDGITAEEDGAEGRLCEIAVTFVARVIVTS